MNISLLLTFIILNIINVIMQTVKSIATLKGTKGVAAIVNAITFALYTVVTIYTMCELPLVTKAVIVGLCNLVGVYIVKFFEEKSRKSKLWKVEITIRPHYAEKIITLLNEMNIPFNWVDINKYYLFNIYCATQKESVVVRNIVEKYNAKYFVMESKIL
jgi:hypothetical protein